MIDEQTPEELVDIIRDACAALGWNICMNESKPTVDGLVIGTPEYVADIVNQLENADEYSIYESGNIDMSIQ